MLTVFSDGSAAAGQARVRAIHAAGELGEGDVQLDGQTLASALPPGEASDYLTVDPGSYSLSVTRPDGGGSPLAESPVSLAAGTVVHRDRGRAAAAARSRSWSRRTTSRRPRRARPRASAASTTTARPGRRSCWRRSAPARWAAGPTASPGVVAPERPEPDDPRRGSLAPEVPWSHEEAPAPRGRAGTGERARCAAGGAPARRLRRRGGAAGRTGARRGRAVGPAARGGPREPGRALAGARRAPAPPVRAAGKGRARGRAARVASGRHPPRAARPDRDSRGTRQRSGAPREGAAQGARGPRPGHGGLVRGRAAARASRGERS